MRTNNNNTQTILEENNVSTLNTTLAEHQRQDLQAINNLQNNDYFNIARARRQGNHETPTVSTAQETTSVSSEVPELTQTDPLSERGTTPTTPSAQQLLFERQQRNARMNYETRPSRRILEENDSTESEPEVDVDTRVLDNIAQESETQTRTLGRQIDHFLNSAQNHQEHATSFGHLANNPPTFFNSLHTWFINNPIWGLVIIGTMGIVGFFVIRRGGGTLTTTTSNIITIGVPAGAGTVIGSNNNENNLSYWQQRIQNYINSFNNVGAIGGVLFIIRRVFRR